MRERLAKYNDNKKEEETRRRASRVVAWPGVRTEPIAAADVRGCGGGASDPAADAASERTEEVRRSRFAAAPSSPTVECGASPATPTLPVRTSDSDDRGERASSALSSSDNAISTSRGSCPSSPRSDESGPRRELVAVSLNAFTCSRQRKSSAMRFMRVKATLVSTNRAVPTIWMVSVGKMYSVEAMPKTTRMLR